MGGNGAGKTTLLNLISGFIKLQKGDILFREESIINYHPYEINRIGIGRTFQDLRLINKLTVKDNIVLAIQDNPTDSLLNAILPKIYFKKSNIEIDKKANDIIETFFLTDVKDSTAANISYGQQKLLSLATCVTNGASLLLLDEPVAGIQANYKDKFATIVSLLKKKNKTILLIDHDMEFISSVADIILFLYEGNIAQFESIEMLKANKKIVEAYM